MTERTRTEHDSLGPIDVPADRLWGAQTERSRRYFRIGGDPMPLEVIYALARVKRAAAQVNAELGVIPIAKAEAIARAAGEIIDGKHDQEFPLCVWQTGSGTQSHMNVNEVIANRASELMGGGRGDARGVHPNDDVNAGQSSNDVFPTAMHLAAVTAIDQLLPALGALRDTLHAKSDAFAEIVKLGRTHLQDATPLTLGQEFSAWVSQLSRAEQRVRSATAPLLELAIGGTAVGTGVNAHPELGTRVARVLASESGHEFVSALNKFEALSSHDALVHAHGTLATLAGALNKIANDVRWLASGPRAGIGELILPANEPGSSIMPGKVNPTQAEAMTMVCAQVLGNDAAVRIAGMNGNFQLNVYKPLLVFAFLWSARLLADACESFREHCAEGLEPNRERIVDNLHRSLMLVTALSPHVGYDRAADIAKLAHAEGITLREAAVASGVSAEDFDRWVRPEQMVGK